MSNELDPHHALATFEHWDGLTDPERIAVGTMIASRLGSEWDAASALCGTRKLAEMIHRPTGIRFVAVPGGACELGMRASELTIGAALEFEEDDTRDLFRQADPPSHVATIRPFLCARTPVLAAQTTVLLGVDPNVVGDEDSEAMAVVRFSPKQAIELLEAVGASFRLLTGDEWEYVARDAGANVFINSATAEDAEEACSALYGSGFDPSVKDAGMNGLGVWGMPWGEWIAAPDQARTPGKSRGGAAMLYPWQSDEIVMCFAGMGDDIGGFDRNDVRFATDLP